MSTTNLLEVENPDEYGCHVENYVSGHSRLAVYVRHDTKNEKFYVDFDRVACFSGALRWHGAVLRLGSDEEYLQFMRQMRPLSKRTDDDLINPMWLLHIYVFEGEDGPVKLIAGRHEIVDRLTG